MTPGIDAAMFAVIESFGFGYAAALGFTLLVMFARRNGGR